MQPDNHSASYTMKSKARSPVTLSRWLYQNIQINLHVQRLFHAVCEKVSMFSINAYDTTEAIRSSAVAASNFPYYMHNILATTHSKAWHSTCRLLVKSVFIFILTYTNANVQVYSSVSYINSYHNRPVSVEIWVTKSGCRGTRLDLQLLLVPRINQDCNSSRPTNH